MAKDRLEVVRGQASWEIGVDAAQAWVTKVGGHLGPVRFRIGKREIEPLSVAPWAEEELDKKLPNIIKGLRGDFFCMPFGGNAKAYRGERYPVHGETANSTWTLESRSRHPRAAMLHLSMKTRIREGRVDKFVIVRDGEPAVYQKHAISGMRGTMNFGHHAMVKFPDAPGSGLISTSATKLRQVWVEPAEDAAMGGYYSLKPGAVFSRLEKVPTVFGDFADLSRFPARRGYEDVVIDVSDPAEKLAWTCVVFPKEKYVWFSLKDPSVLAATLFWISNGGRHYAPWNGRHTGVMGIEEVTSFFHAGLAESAGRNTLSARGVKTAVMLSPRKPLVVNYIFGVAGIPAGFDHVRELSPFRGGIEIVSRNGKRASVACDTNFLYSGL